MRFHDKDRKPCKFDLNASSIPCERMLYDSVKYENFFDTKRQEICLVNIILIILSRYKKIWTYHIFLSLSIKMLEKAGNLEVSMVFWSTARQNFFSWMRSGVKNLRIVVNRLGLKLPREKSLQQQ